MNFTPPRRTTLALLTSLSLAAMAFSQGAELAPPDFSADGLVARVASQGVSFASDSDSPAWRLELSSESIGRRGWFAPLGAGALASVGSTRRIDRGQVIEMFEAHQRGVLQSWRVLSAPQQAAPGDHLILQLALDTDLSPRLSEDRRAVLFASADGVPRVNYSGLQAFDATGRELAASLALAPRRLEIHVDDANAQYPLTIDPLTSSAVWSFESNQAGAFLGAGVSAAGDVNADGYSDLLVGAPRYDFGSVVDAGRVQLFYGSAAGLALNPAWTLDGAQAGAQLGTWVASAGDVNADGFGDFVVGEPFYDGGQTDEGRCHLFLGAAAGVVASTWKPESNQASARFGECVSWAGDVNGDGFDDVIVGAPYFDAGQSDEGRVFVYLGLPSGLSPSPVWIFESNQAGAHYGHAVATAGDTDADGYDELIVGAPDWNNGSFADAGLAHVFRGSAFGPLNTPNYIGTVSQASARTGWAVGPAGDVNGDGYADVSFSAPWYSGSATDEGLVWVKTGSAAGISGTGWSELGGAAGAGWGYSVGSAGDVDGDGYPDLVASSVYWENSSSTASEGAAWLYTGSASGLLAAAAQQIGQGNQASAFFGHRVGCAGDVNGDGFADTFVASGYFDAGQSDEGKVWVHLGLPKPLSSTPQASFEPNSALARAGEVVANAGDVDGDGFDDWTVASPSHAGAFPQGGRVQLFRGGAGTLSTTAAWTLDAEQAGEALGEVQGVAAAGDVDGDGYADLIVGGANYDSGALVDAGRARVYLGGPTGLSATAAWTFVGAGADERFGSAVAGAGDIDGDGYHDVLVGAPGFDSGRGRVYFFRGSRAGLEPTPARVMLHPEPALATPASFGLGLAIAGDVDGDGFDDVLVSAPHSQAGQRAYLFRGGRKGPLGPPTWSYANVEWSLLPQWTLQARGAGDVNADGFADVVIGAELEDFRAGRAYLFLGGAPGGLATTPAWQVSGAPNARVGRAVGAAGDVNRDGYGDLAVGAPDESGNQAAEGKLAIYTGGPLGLSSAPTLALESSFATAGFGTAFDGSGDFDGDGFTDLVVGAPLADNGSIDEGRVELFLGGQNTARTRRLQQRRSDDSRPIVEGAGLLRASTFRIAVDAFSLAGRGEVRLEWELESVGAPFDGQGLEHSPFEFDTGAPLGGLSVARASEATLVGPGPALLKWRVRVASRHPLFPRSPWMSLSGGSPGEAKLRVLR